MALPWLLTMALSISLAFALNTATRQAQLTGASSAGFSVFEPVDNLCALDVDGALYAGWDSWLPAGRTRFCTADEYPGVGGRKEMNGQLTRVGVLQATIIFKASTDILINLHCLAGLQQRSVDANFVPVAEARDLYHRVCAS
jgi:hypothetical protein